MSTLEALLPDVMARWSILADGVIGHSDIAPLRKADPGRRFDWARLALSGFAVWPEAGEAPVDASRFLDLAESFGYRSDAGCDAVLDALRQRFRPWAEGALDARDMGIVVDLAHRFPVDPKTSIA